MPWWRRAYRWLAHSTGNCPRERAGHNCDRYPERCGWELEAKQW